MKSIYTHPPPPKRNFVNGFLGSAVAIFLAVLVGSCATKQGSQSTSQHINPPASHSSQNCRNVRPRVHSIGTTNILVFKKSDRNDPNDNDEIGIEILIEGRDLIRKGCVKLGVKVGGTLNALLKHDFAHTSPPEGGGSFTVTIKNRYLENLQTGDQIEVTVLSLPHEEVNDLKIRTRLTNMTSRVFSVFTLEDYRTQVIERRIPIQDIEAFPLPESEAKRLFGPVVSKNFFTVRLAVRNTNAEDKLISTSMIVANGRMIVEPHWTVFESRSDRKKIPRRNERFTVPVQLVPQSLEHIYTMIDDAEVGQGRSLIFRGLEFVGALASAATAAFGASTDLISGVGLLTGVAIPEGKTLWVDRWPGYERNIVSFAMPDLLKVPGGSISGHKYIFFSKNKLEAVVSDKNLFGHFGGRQPKQPKIAIASVQFDALEIPFEEVFVPTARTLIDRVNAVRAELPSLRERLRTIERGWISVDNGTLDARLTRTHLNEIVTSLRQASSGVNDAKTRQDEAVFEARNQLKLTLDAPTEDITTAIDAISENLQALGPEDDTSIGDTQAQITEAVVSPLQALLDPKLANIISNLETYTNRPELYEPDTIALRAGGNVFKNAVIELTEAHDKLTTITTDSLTKDTRSTLTVAKTALSKVKTAIDNLIRASEVTRTDAQVLAQWLETVERVGESMQPDVLQYRLLANPQIGSAAMERHERTLRDADIAATRGASLGTFGERLEEAETAVSKLRQALTFVSLVADKMAPGIGQDRGEIGQEVDRIQDPLTDDTIEQLAENFELHFIGLFRQAHEGLDIAPVLRMKDKSEG